MTDDTEMLAPVARLVRALAALQATQVELTVALDTASGRACRLIEALDLSFRVEASRVHAVSQAGEGC